MGASGPLNLRLAPLRASLKVVPFTLFLHSSEFPNPPPIACLALSPWSRPWVLQPPRPSSLRIPAVRACPTNAPGLLSFPLPFLSAWTLGAWPEQTLASPVS